MKSVGNLLKVVKNFKTEMEAIQFFMKQRWNGKVECPFGTCSAESKVYNLKSGKDFKCSCCGKIFSYKTRTIFEDTKIPMRKWFMAIYLIVNHKKGISSLQLGRDIDVTQKTAWFMLHRIRHILGLDDDNMFDGTTECDEVCLGGKEGNKHAAKKNTNAYLQEVSFRYSTRKVSDEFRLISLLTSTQGRLTYKSLIA